MNYLKHPERPEPGRPIGRVVERIIEKQSTTPQPNPPIDINALISAITQAIQAIPSKQTIVNANGMESIEDFDNSKTMEQLANSMTVQRGKKESNFENLGNEHHTKTSKKEKKEVQNTIDLLSNLND